jgi:DNA modification methylase
MSSIRRARNNHTMQHLEDARVHDWYRFVLSYPDHLVAEVIQKFNVRRGQSVLDPFVGTGTTLVECKKRGIHSIGIDANPVTAFASAVKTNWDIDLTQFDRRYVEIQKALQQSSNSFENQQPFQLSFDDFDHDVRSVDSPGDGGFVEETDDNDITTLFPKDWISPLPLRKVMLIRQVIDRLPADPITDLMKLALASIAVTDASNLGFGPEVYLSKKREDADVYGAFIRKLRRIREDLLWVQAIQTVGKTQVFCGDARQLGTMVNEPIDFVITSPPYPNEKDYTRITRLELVLLGFMRGRDDLRQVKESMLRSHTRNIYVDDADSTYVEDVPEVRSLAQEIEAARIRRNATSGFERLYHRVVTEYFGGMYRVLEQLQQVMPAGSKLALVVGDQMSYFRVPINTAKLISLIAGRKLRYRELETLIWRTRVATATRANVEEHILILERL